MKIIPNTGRGLYSIIVIRTTQPIINESTIFISLGYVIRTTSKGPLEGNVTLIPAKVFSKELSHPLRIGAAITDFNPEAKSTDAYPKPKNNI